MKKSELKALIREVVEEVQSSNKNATAKKIATALRANPKVAQKLAAVVGKSGEQSGEQLEEGKLSSGWKALIFALAAMGVTGDTIAQAAEDHGALVTLARMAQQAVKDTDKIRSDKAAEFGYKTINAEKGSTLDIHRQMMKDPKFAKFVDDHNTAAYGNNPDKEKADGILKTAIEAAVKRYKQANDFKEEQKFLAGNVYKIIAQKMPIKDIQQIIKDNPDWLN